MNHEEFIHRINIINESVVIQEAVFDYEPWLKKQSPSLGDAASWLAVEIGTYGNSPNAKRAYNYYDNDEAFFSFIADLYRKYGDFNKVADALVDRDKFRQANGKDLGVLLKRTMLPNAAERKTTTYKWLEEYLPHVLEKLETEEEQLISTELKKIVTQFQAVMNLPNPEAYFADAKEMLHNLIQSAVPAPVAHGTHDENAVRRNAVSRLSAMLKKARNMEDLSKIVEHARFALE